MARLKMSICLAILSFCPTALAFDETVKVRKFVETVILHSEYGNKEEGCQQWIKSPTVAIFNGSDQARGVLQTAVLELNEILFGTRMSLKLSKRPTNNADIKIIIAPYSQFPEIARQHGFEYVKPNWAFFYIWSKKFIIFRAVILIASDKYNDSQRQFYTRQELTQALGLMSDSDLFPSSIFYEKKGQRRSDPATTFSDLDKRLIRFYYLHIKPGDQREDVRRAFDLYWKDNKLVPHKE